MAGLLLVVGCRPVGPPTAASGTPPAAPSRTAERVLTAADVQAFIAVRSKALQRLEDALAEVERSGGDVLGRVQELTVAEREAARSLGVEWRRFTWIRDEIGRLLTSQRQHEDQRVLDTELSRSREDLEAQLKSARDPATRQFLEAQLKVLSAQLGAVTRDRKLPGPEAEELRVLESARAEIATLQGRQDRVQHRLQELLQRASGAAPAASGPG